MTTRHPVRPENDVERYRAAGYWTDETLGAVLRHRARRDGAKLAVIAGHRRLTYAELDTRVDALATGLRRLGIARGDHVVIQLPNIAAFHEVCFALFRLGAIPVMALPALRGSEITQICTHTRAVAYVVAATPGTDDCLALASTVVDAVTHPLQVLTVGTLPGRHLALEDFYDAGTSGAEEVEDESKAHEVALLQIAGGTSSHPELVPRTHADYLYTARRCAELVELDRSSVYLAALPAAHNFPLASPGVIGAVVVGATCVLAPVPSPQAVFGLIEAEQVTHCSAVPSLTLVWLEVFDGRHDLSSWRVLQVGGAKCSPDLAQRIRTTFGCIPQQAYGMAEGIICFTRLDDPTEVIDNTQGRPISPGDEIRVVDPSGSDVPNGVVGELIARGPYTITGYHGGINQSDFTVDGYFHTGDLVRLRSDGNIVIEGRLKRQINRGGEKIAIAEVEHHLLSHPDVIEVALTSVPDRFLGERSTAHVTLRDQSSIKATDLRTFLHDCGIAGYKIPDRFHFHTEPTGVR